MTGASEVRLLYVFPAGSAEELDDQLAAFGLGALPAPDGTRREVVSVLGRGPMSVRMRLGLAAQRLPGGWYAVGDPDTLARIPAAGASPP